MGRIMIEKPKYSEEWTSKLIELSTESVYCYEKYLLDKSDWKELAIKMKSLQKHINKYMGTSVSDKKIFE